MASAPVRAASSPRYVPTTSNAEVRHLAGEELEQTKRVVIGSVQIVEQHGGRLVGDELLDQRRDGVEEGELHGSSVVGALVAGAGVGADLGDDRPQPAESGDVAAEQILDVTLAHESAAPASTASTPVPSFLPAAPHTTAKRRRASSPRARARCVLPMPGSPSSRNS